MTTEIDDINNNHLQKPQIFFNNVIFNDGTQLNLQKNSIVVFTGPNNCGKSQVLKDLDRKLTSSNQASGIIVKSARFEFLGSIDNPDFIDSLHGISFDMDNLQRYWNTKTLHPVIHNIFVKLLSTGSRLTVSNALARGSPTESHPISILYKSEETAKKISDYYRQAFGVDLVVNRNGIHTIPLHIGQAPDKTAYTIDKQDIYYNLVNKLPKLQEQGDGMRSFASILLDTFTSGNTITLIDEPDAFLHPPQARIIGRMLAKNNPDNRQLFIATHSEDFLQGLLDADSENVTVIRIVRNDNLNNMSILENKDIAELWDKPLLRYSNILSGLFHEKVVICESDYDCLFYQAILDAIYENPKGTSPDILFTHCGGKSRMKDVVSALRAVNVPVVSICDFDLLNSSHDFKQLAAAFGLDWNNQLDASMQIIYNGINARNSTGNDVWKQLKKTGKHGLLGNEPAEYEAVEAVCQSVGLYIVPIGEIESFERTINKEKRDWVYYILENYDLSSEPKLEDARKFVQSFVDFIPT